MFQRTGLASRATPLNTALGLMIKHFAWILMSLGALACATTPVLFAKASPVPKDRLFPGSDRFSEHKEGTVRVIVVRDTGMLGSGVRTEFRIDGDPIATLWTSERLELFLPIGQHIFSVAPSPRLGGALVETAFTLESGRSYAFRIGSPGTGALAFQPSTELE